MPILTLAISAPLSGLVMRQALRLQLAQSSTARASSGIDSYRGASRCVSRIGMHDDCATCFSLYGASAYSCTCCAQDEAVLAATTLHCLCLVRRQDRKACASKCPHPQTIPELAQTCTCLSLQVPCRTPPQSNRHASRSPAPVSSSSGSKCAPVTVSALLRTSRRVPVHVRHLVANVTTSCKCAVYALCATSSSHMCSGATK